MSDSTRIAALTIDEKSVTARQPETLHDRQVAISDLLEWNHFALKGAKGPYTVALGSSESRITLSITSPAASQPVRLTLALQSFRTLIQDYFLICESYREALKGGNLPRIEAIDVSRRGLHNEGAELLTSLLAARAEMDFETARRLFTLICVLHVK